MTTQDVGTGENTEEPQEGVEDVEEGTEEPRTYTAEEYEAIKEESIANRLKAKRATELETALRAAVIREATRDVLADPEDLAWSDEFNDDETGLPDPEKITAAAEALTEAKPQLAAVRGDVGAGFRGDESDAAAVDLAGMLRAGA